MTENEITQRILKSAFEVHTVLGPGLLESAYEECLYYQTTKDGLFIQRQVAMPLIYKEVKLDAGYRIDLLVERQVVVEIKVVESFNDIHLAQVLTYLKLSGCKVGLLLNFNVKSLKHGIKRVVL
ncbi:MAG: GxxExxY protein [Bacteroidetes bacterium]|nr:MAG: GxxExxY protein [Bacteroidota bacterium]